MGGPRKKGKAGKKKYKHKTVSITPEILEPQPPGRYNLGFYYDYEDQGLKKLDKAYLTAYHNKFPKALASEDVWKHKTPRSRNSCKFDRIESVNSLTDFVKKILNFTNEKAREGAVKKFGTIFLLAHGWRDGLLLPIADARAQEQVLEFKDLIIGLKNIDALGKDCPKEWSKKDWQSLRKPFLTLKTEIVKLHKRRSWFDKETLMRLWCCRLGDSLLVQTAKALRAMGKSDKEYPDPLKLFARTLVGPRGHVSIEAPQTPTSGNTASSWGKGGTAPHWSTFTRTYEKEKAGPEYYDKYRRKKRRRKKWHPDIIAEVESGKDGKRLRSKGDLDEAKISFVEAILQPAPSPTGERKGKWIPWLTLNPTASILEGELRWLHILRLFEGDDEAVKFKYTRKYKGKDGKIRQHEGYWRKVTV